MPVLIAGVAALVIGLGAGFVIFSPGEDSAVEETGEEEAAVPAETADEYKARLLQLEPIVANIEGDGYTRLLKMTVVLECESADARGEAEGRMAQIRDSTLTLVSSRRLVDLIDFDGKALLKDDLRDRVNQILTAGRVESVLLTEFVVQ
jgi:flagellar FliL protein